ncbi:type II toxin-antitoxin system RelE/ParE family toxin [Sphaerisporangium sp. NPDC088356]|uniref:type II toxin-antitoxin system RelE family toxin n=1 Tax=Sphaerisporangium sp. NPDC088356 TaxID=3154871 RepID=UPI00344A7CFF
MAEWESLRENLEIIADPEMRAAAAAEARGDVTTEEEHGRGDGRHHGCPPAKPPRAGKPLNEPYEELQVARRGTYRVVYRIDEDKPTVTITSTEHRRDAYRP